MSVKGERASVCSVLSMRRTTLDEYDICYMAYMNMICGFAAAV